MIQLDDKLYTSTEVADILGVSLRSVYRYLEENKIDAEVKTATGRHRFSRKNILDFLYPNGADASTKPQEPVLAEPIKAKVAAPKKPAEPKEKEVQAEIPVEEPIVVEEKTEDAEPIDWLAKFREAARKYREESGTAEDAPLPTESAPLKESVKVEPVKKEQPESSLVENDAFAEPEVKKPTQRYYRSSLGGLKDIAQNIDKGSRNSFLDYAFTLNAGLSLYKPIKPFSILHVYVKPSDLTFFEKLLGLTPSDEANAQLCLIPSDESEVYSRKEELHGLFVVDRSRLLNDTERMGDSVLSAEASGILS